MTKLFTILSAVALATLSSTTAFARADFHDLPVKDAVESDLGQERLLDVPFYMAGQKYPAVARDMGEFKSDQRSNGFGKSDESACGVAFLSALISLQKRVHREGGDAIIDVKSVTRGNALTSAINYRCVAGNVVVNVALTGRVVKFK